MAKKLIDISLSDKTVTEKQKEFSKYLYGKNRKISLEVASG